MNAKSEIYFANEGPYLEFCKTDIWHVFRSFLGKEVGVMFRGKRPHVSEYVISLSHLNEKIIVVDTKLCCFLSASKLKAGNI